LRSDPLAPRSGERVRERGLRTIALTLLSLAACSASSAPGASDSTPIQSPADSTGGYIVATLPPGMGTARATLYDSTGQSELASFVADAPGAPLSFWWRTAPGQTTRVALRDDTGAPYTYDLASTYTQVADPYEPNDAMDAAAPMPDGGQMTAFLFAGRGEGTTDPTAYDHYFPF